MESSTISAIVLCCVFVNCLHAGVVAQTCYYLSRNCDENDDKFFFYNEWNAEDCCKIGSSYSDADGNCIDCYVGGCFADPSCNDVIDDHTTNETKCCALNGQSVLDDTFHCSYGLQCPGCYADDYCFRRIDKTSLTERECCAVNGYSILLGQDNCVQLTCQDVCTDTLTCQNGGLPDDDCSMCVCPPGFTGDNCQTNIDDCDPNPCMNKQICKDGVNSYTCTCTPGYTGMTCSINIDDCFLNPCQNGFCLDRVNSYTCVCPPGYNGINCEISTDVCASSPCLNGGTCQNGMNSYTCVCAPGYTGYNCQTIINNCNPNPCQNGGICEDRINSFTCDCKNGFTGDTCSIGCHLSELCDDVSITIQTSSVSECCELGGRSFSSGTSCTTACGLTKGDPHFTVPLLSKDILCYSVRGSSGLAYNLIYNKDFVINAYFVETERDVTSVGKFAVIPHNNNKSNAVVFDSVSQEVVVVGEGVLSAAMIKQIIFSENDTVEFTQKFQKQTGNPVIHVIYRKLQAEFDVTFYHNLLDVDWSMNYDKLFDSHGLIGQFMKKGIHIDGQKEMLHYSDDRDPVPVTRYSTKTDKWCWKVKNYGDQGEGLIEGDILDYVVPTILDVPVKLEKFIKTT